MKRYPFNRLWFQFSAVIVGVVLLTAVTLAIGTVWMRPPAPSPGPRGAVTVRRPEERSWLVPALTRDALILAVAGGILAIAAGVLLSRRMTAPLDDLAAGATAIGAGDLAHRVTPTGSMELVALANSFNQMAANLEEAEQLRRNLLADVAHELRTPLTVLQGNLRAILDDVYALDKAEVARLYDQTRHLNRLVNDLHELAQAEARQLPLNMEPVDVRELIENTLDLFEAICESQEVALHKDLPAAAVVVRADRARLTQALQNLLTNALRYTPAGGTITVALRQAGRSVQIEVRDTGDGIEAADLPHVFDRFYRAGRARNRDAGGAGLGLALVRAIVTAHAGSVEGASAGRGRGSTFTIDLPAAPVAGEAAPAVGQPANMPPGSQPALAAAGAQASRN